MPTWLFGIIVLLIGLGLAFYVDRMKVRPGSVSGEPKRRSERSKWLYYWFAGRFPTREEDAADEEEARRLKEEEQERELEERRKKRGEGQ